MKTFARLLPLFVCALLLSPSGWAASNSGVQITAKEKSSGKTVYQGQTTIGGKFSTPALQSGSYVFEFTSKDSPGFKIALSGPRTAKQTSGRGNRVVFAIEMGKAAKVNGQVMSTSAVVASADTKGAPAMEKVRANVKVMNGKRYIWVPGEIGSNMGGKWVEEGTEGAVIRDTNRKGGDTEVLRHIQDQSGNVGRGGR